MKLSTKPDMFYTGLVSTYFFKCLYIICFNKPFLNSDSQQAQQAVALEPGSFPLWKEK